ncbi:MAG: hypothetical protein ABR499_22800 [Gemmatimonadaceae bacterium]
MTPGVVVVVVAGPAGAPATVTLPTSFCSMGGVAFSGAGAGFGAGLAGFMGRLVAGFDATRGEGRRRSLGDVVSAAGAGRGAAGSDTLGSSAGAGRRPAVRVGAGAGADCGFGADRQADTSNTPMTKSP